jgi:hypothetical protein
MTIKNYLTLFSFFNTHLFYMEVIMKDHFSPLSDRHMNGSDPSQQNLEQDEQMISALERYLRRSMVMQTDRLPRWALWS